MANYTKLWKGCKGDDVARMQAALAALGYDLGAGGVDGGFGKDTEAAVIAFQRDFDLAVDGVAGDETLGNLYRDWDKFGATTARCIAAIRRLPEFREFMEVYNG